MFRVGQRVVYVRETPRSLSGRIRHIWYYSKYPYSKPRRGAVYTVSQIHVRDGASFLSLYEVPEEHLYFWSDGFPSQCFRPIVERKTDISVFKAMLNPAREDA